jgi:hypothetical protein
MTKTNRIAVARTTSAFLIGMAPICPAPGVAQTAPVASTGKIHTSYIAADEVDWDYAPGSVNKMMGMKFEGYPTVYQVEP